MAKEAPAATGGVTRTCAACGVSDALPHHAVSGVRTERQSATLPSGQVIPVDVPVDESYHMDCHAKMGCDVCADIVDHNGGEVVAGAVEVPDHLVDLAPGEFTHDDRGVLTRALSKEDARAAHDEAVRAAGYDVIDHDEAHALHLSHAAGEVN